MEAFNLDLFGNRPKNEFKKIKHYIVKELDVKYENAQKLVYDLNMGKDEIAYVNTTGNFVFGDFITALIVEHKMDVEELWIKSLSGSIENFEGFVALIERGWVKKINLMLSGYYMRTEKAKNSPTIEYLRAQNDEKKGVFNVFYSETHAKIVCIKTKKGGFMVITGSANLRSSQSFEQLVIHTSKEAYEFQTKSFFY